MGRAAKRITRSAPRIDVSDIPSSSLDVLSEKTTKEYSSNPSVDYLNLAQQAETVSKGHVHIQENFKNYPVGIFK